MRKSIFVLASLAVPFAIGCGGAGGTGTRVLIPTITAISPTSAQAGGGAFTLTITGTNFAAASMVDFGGTTPATTFVSPTQLTAAIPASAIAFNGTVAVQVTNPPPSHASNSANFTIASGPNPVPTINSLDPGGAPTGGPAFNLFVSGTNFVASSVVRWNGSDRPTTVVDADTVEAQIPASDIVANGTSTVTVFNPAPGGGSSNALTFPVATGAFPQSVAVDPTGKFAYVANFGFADVFVGYVSTYSIDSTTGGLTPVGPPVAAAHGPSSVAVSGKFVYVTDSGDQGGGEDVGDVSMYAIDAATGALSSIGTISGVCPGLCVPLSMAVDASGKYTYVANEGGPAPTAVSMFTINATTGVLASIGTITAGGRAISVAADPSGRFAYVANGDGGLSMYTINATTGALTSLGVIDAGTGPASVAVDPAGTYTYVANSGSNNVSMYTINGTTGALTSTGAIAAGSSPSSIAIHPFGKFAYVTNSGSHNVSMYSIDATTGGLNAHRHSGHVNGPHSVTLEHAGNFSSASNSIIESPKRGS